MWISRTDEMLVSSVKHRCCYDDRGGYRLLPSSPLYSDITESSWHVIVYLIKAMMSAEAASWLRVCVTVYMRYHMVCRTCLYTCISFHYQEHLGSAEANLCVLKSLLIAGDHLVYVEQKRIIKMLQLINFVKYSFSLVAF